MLSNTPISKLTPYVDEITGDYLCEFRRKKSTTGHIFRVRQIVEKKWKHNGTGHQVDKVFSGYQPR